MNIFTFGGGLGVTLVDERPPMNSAKDCSSVSYSGLAANFSAEGNLYLWIFGAWLFGELGVCFGLCLGLCFGLTTNN